MSPEQSGFVLEPEGIARLEGRGIRYPDHGLAHEREEAVAIADRIGYPVVMKIVSTDVIHKTDVGGVRTGIGDPDQLRAVYDRMLEDVRSRLPKADVAGVLICKHARDGVEVIVGVSRDPVFGKVLMCGLGGIYAEVIKDVSFRALPLRRIDAEEMIKELSASDLINGARGRPTCGIDKFADFLESVARFIDENDDIMELDLNPVRLHQDGAEVLDVRMFARR